MQPVTRPDPPTGEVRQCDVLVIGGGVTGCATAWNLALAGADVVLVEEHDLNTQGSGRNAGSLHGQIQFPSFRERGEDWARSFAPALRLLIESLEIWDGLKSVLGTDVEVVRNGGLLVADSDDQMRMIERKVALEQEIGVPSVVLTKHDLAGLAPYLSNRVIGGELCPVEGKANPLLAVPALASAARAQGAEIQAHTRVVGIDREPEGLSVTTSHGRILARRVVASAGNGLNAVSGLVGHSLPIIDEPVQVSVTEPVEPFVNHLVYYAGDKLTFKQAKAGSLLIGGGWQADIHPVTGAPTVNVDSLRRNLSVALRVVPSIAGVRVIRSWAGVGLGTPDLLPIIGEVDGVVVGAFPHMGFTAGPRMGEILARIALGHDPSVDLSPFAPERFS
jgi:sarcosine oxidase, subunit beta